MVLSGEQSLIYGCYSKENDSKVEQERCKYLEDPRGKPHQCKRSKCSEEQYVYEEWVLGIKFYK